jgi:pimeloyl-ACP methyl ester carboxylesterase
MQRLVLSLIFLLGTVNSFGQKLRDIAINENPLVLKSIGSFYVGGETEWQSKSELGGFFPEGYVTVNQMYVNFMIPQETKDSSSMVFIHGITLSGKTYETTPDGRMGWNEYFARKGYPVYVVDQVGIGRSGFNQKTYNKSRIGESEASLNPPMIRISDENVNKNFRFTSKDNQAVPESKFPPTAYPEFSKQSIPFTATTVPNPNPSLKNLAVLSKELKKTVLVSHSQSGSFPLEAALIDPSGIAAMVIVEPGGIGTNYTDDQLKALSKIPLLLVYGDYLENDTEVKGHNWKSAIDGWSKLVDRLNAAGGRAKILHLPAVGIRGNSHMLMMDTNNQQIADLIIDWLDSIKN